MAIKKKGHLLEASYTEEAVAIALSTFFAVASYPNRGLTIEPFSGGKERWLGADARIFDHISGFKPFYMQFKKPSAYPDYSTSRIIKNRKSLLLETSPNSLFFNLREKGKAHVNYQHNILYKLRNRLKKYTKSDAAYVCPLFLEHSAYLFHLHAAALRWSPFERYPWGNRRVTIEGSGTKSTFADIPFLAEHVCIPPHTSVTTAKHSYSFTESGKDLCFHSPESISEGIVNFGVWFDSLTDDIFSSDYLVNVQQSKDKLKRLITGDEQNDALPYPDGLLEIEDGMVAWSEWGKYLREIYSIHQYFLVVWK